ncbi:CsbD family protein [Frankia sp. Cppng1_Ct_nod]|uniref:CsbD family protein n=1 Tax=Frankia sp. Cppng1_Ct_nod TaxID=2897162 RepID=UPI001041266B|nr:CsbD family protein [Frankia sp. Cppng1_Ct_nod]
MSFTDKVRNKVEQLSGRMKEKTGHATDNKDLEAEGRSDRTKANLKDAGEKTKDAFKE